MTEQPPPYPPLRVSCLIWSLGAIFYLIGFFHRLAPAVMTRELMHDFGISAAALGNLSGFYFYSYWLMQIPTGILADTWGPRRLLTFGALGTAGGAVLFGLSPDIVFAGFGRTLIGGSVAVAFVVNLKLATHWFPAGYFSTISGIAILAGILGGVSAGVPLRLGVDVFGWRQVMLASAAGTCGLAAVIWALVRDDPNARGFRSYADARPEGKAAGGHPGRNLIEVFRSRNTWLLCIIPAGIVGSVLTFCGLWGVPYLTTHYGLSSAEAAALTTLLMVSWAIGSPFAGRFSDRVGRRKPLMLIGQALAAAGWSFILFVSGLPVWLLAVLMAATGICSASFNICWPLAKESVPLRLSGTISGVINMGIMLGPTVLQPTIGWVLDHRWRGETLGGIRLYSLDAYHAGFALMLGWMLLGWVLIFFTRETHCRQAA